MSCAALATRKLFAGLIVALLCLHAHASDTLSREAAVKLAETFIAENGYTNLPAPSTKPELDSESIEWSSDRNATLTQRFNSLRPVAIGARLERGKGGARWSIAFDYASKLSNSDTCRVVTMALDGSDIRVEHVDGIRKYFAGFR